MSAAVFSLDVQPRRTAVSPFSSSHHRMFLVHQTVRFSTARISLLPDDQAQFCKQRNYAAALRRLCSPATLRDFCKVSHGHPQLFFREVGGRGDKRMFKCQKYLTRITLFVTQFNTKYTDTIYFNTHLQYLHTKLALCSF
jgi:hypothetical protein